MKTYAESRGHEPFDWNAFLKCAKTEQITEDEWEKVTELAKDWVTCATGNQCAIIPRDNNGIPTDTTAVMLGGDRGFYGCIKTRNISGALHYLCLIEQHSAYLIEIEVEKHREALENGVEALRKLKACEG